MRKVFCNKCKYNGNTWWGWRNSYCEYPSIFIGVTESAIHKNKKNLHGECEDFKPDWWRKLWQRII